VASFFLHQLSLFFPNRKKVLELGSIREQSKIRKAEEKKERKKSAEEMGHMDTHMLSVLLGTFWRYQAQDAK
jgi:hypothetical protein